MSETTHNDAIIQKDWDEFRNTGLPVYINQILHIFGWAITFQVDDNGKVENAFPSRVKFRGFDNDTVTKSYKKLSDYLKNNAKILDDEIQDF